MPIARPAAVSVIQVGSVITGSARSSEHRQHEKDRAIAEPPH